MKIKYAYSVVIFYSFFVIGMNINDEQWDEIEKQPHILRKAEQYQAAEVLTTLIDRMKELLEIKKQYFSMTGAEYQLIGFLVLKTNGRPRNFQVPYLTFENEYAYYLSEERFADFIRFIMGNLLTFTWKDNSEYWSIVTMLQEMTKKIMQAKKEFEDKIKNFERRPWWKKLFI